jgi:hypothetical protein
MGPIKRRFGRLLVRGDQRAQSVPQDGATQAAKGDHLLFGSDPDRFLKLLYTADSEERLAGLFPDEISACEITRYGIYNDEKMIAPLQKLYSGILADGMSEDKRRDVYQFVAGFVATKTAVSPNALLPFISEEPSSGIVATAVIDYVSIADMTGGDPMSRPRDIVGMIESGMLKNTGAVFGGLLHLGDPRVCKLIWPLRNSLEPSGVDAAIKSFAGFLSAATIDFELSWLEEMEGGIDDGLFGTVAYGILFQKRHAKIPVVATGERPIPGAGLTPEQQRAMQRWIPIEDYAKQIAPRLFALERTEPPPRVMPHVIREWGLEPLSRPEQTDGIVSPASLPSQRREHTDAEETQSATATTSAEKFVCEEEEWFDENGRVYAVWGLSNPNGPTLYCLGDRVRDGRHTLFYRWMHMLGGRTWYSSEVRSQPLTYSDIANTTIAIQNHLVSQGGEDGIMDKIPSFVLASNNDEGLLNFLRYLLSKGPAAQLDWGQELFYLRKFGSNAFDRAGAEIRAVMEQLKAEAASDGRDISDAVRVAESRFGQIPSYREYDPPTFESSRLTTALFEEWWSRVNNPSFRLTALLHFAEMWVGAISLARHTPLSKIRKLVEFDQIRVFFSDFGMELWPETLTTDVIEHRIGIRR